MKAVEPWGSAGSVMVLLQGKALKGFEVGVRKGLVFTSPPGVRGQTSGLS